jgi:hypothetical protein
MTSTTTFGRLAVQTAPSHKSTPMARFVASTIIAATIAYLLCLADEDLFHWFLIPVIACGGLVGMDVFRWITGELDLFDPVGLLAVLSVHFFFLAPIIEIIADTKLLFVSDQPADYRPWLGLMACINFVGLLCYKFAVSTFVRRRKRLAFTWTLKGSTFLPVLGTAILISIAAEVYVLYSFGGIVGLIHTFSEDQYKFNDTGWLFMLSESLPILMMIGVSAFWWKRRISWALLSPLLMFFLSLQFLLGGLRGSRQNSIWAMVWALGIVHFGIRRVSRRTIGLFAIAAVTFMYFYGFYKYAGAEGVKALTDSEWRTSAAAKSGRGFGNVLVQDLGRSDVQAFALYRLTTDAGAYEYAYGRTYIGAINLLVPRWIEKDRLPTKGKWTTNLEYGLGAYESNHQQSSRVYGLAGEAMLNFGILGVPLAFGLFGWLIAQMSTLANSVDRNDCRILLVPFLSCLSMVILAHDFDVDMFILIKNLALPFCVIYFGSTRTKIQTRLP